MRSGDPVTTPDGYGIAVGFDQRTTFGFQQPIKESWVLVHYPDGRRRWHRSNVVSLSTRKTGSLRSG